MTTAESSAAGVPAPPRGGGSAAEAFEAALLLLSGRRAAFVQEYLIDLNATAAAKRCGYAEGSAHVTGCRLLSDAKVAAAVSLGKEARSVRSMISADAVVLELARLAFADVRKVATWGAGTVALVDSVALDDDTAAAVVEVSAGKHGPKLKLASKLQALDRLQRHLEARQRAEAGKGDDGSIAAVLEAGRARVAAARAAAADAADG